MCQRNRLLLLILAMFAIFTAGKVEAGLGGEEAEIQQVLLPPQGFDDNDDVELVVDGKLPNACHRLTKTKVTINRFKKRIKVRQLIARRNIPMCENEEAHDMDFPVRFKTVYSLGSLANGNYEIYFGNNQVRRFTVAASSQESVDDFLYAPVSRVFVSDIAYADEEVNVILSGVIEQNCLKIDTVDKMVFSDVIVFLPKMTALPGVPCSPTLKSMQEIVNLGKLPKGRYLLQVRSMTGGAVNEVFSVVERTFDPRKENSESN